MGQIMKNYRFLYLRLYIDTQIQVRSASGFKRQEQPYIFPLIDPD